MIVRRNAKTNQHTGAEHHQPLFLLVVRALAAVGISIMVAACTLHSPQPIPVTSTPSPSPSPTVPPTLTPNPSVTPNPLGIGRVTFDTNQQYAFPVAADPGLLEWTHYHWDGTNAADVEAHPDLTFAEFLAVTHAPLVAITNGTLLNYSGDTGGLGYMLQGDDGLDYYYGHMAEQWLADGTRVSAGQPIGMVGNTGRTAQFIEPHLHLAIGPRDSLWTQQPAVNAAEFLRNHFHLAWTERPTVVEPGYAVPAGWPVQHPALKIVTPFDQAAANGLFEPAIELGFVEEPPGGPLPVTATLTGEVNVIRWTASYGTRVQITNDASQITVVISGLNEWYVEDGEIVQHGQALGRWNPANRPRLHYMIFENGVIIDPTLMLDRPGDTGTSPVAP